MKRANIDRSLPLHRIDYVKQELKNHGYSTDPAALIDRVARETAYALFAPVHEQKLPAYGAIVTDDWNAHSSYIPHWMTHVSVACGVYERTLADGTSGFAVCEKESAPRIIWSPGVSLSSEAALFSLRNDVLFEEPGRSPHAPPTGTDLVLIQRLSSGDITVLHWDGVTTLRNGHWSFRHYQYKFQVEERIKETLGRLSDDMETTIRRVLGMCLHVLSPAGCGATIVASIDDDNELPKSLNYENAGPALADLTVNKRAHHRLFAHLLGQKDGTTVIGEKGDLKCVGAWMNYQSKSPSLGGSRQLAAQETSKKCTSPILTVSADGPVRVFHQGKLIADFANAPA